MSRQRPSPLIAFVIGLLMASLAVAYWGRSLVAAPIPALLVGLPLLGLSVPAGVFLFVRCQRAVKKIIDFIEARRAPLHVPLEQSLEKPLPALAGTLLFEAGAPILDLVMTDDDTCWVLDRGKSLRRLEGQSVVSLSCLTLEEPRGLARLPEGKCAVVDGVGKVSILSMELPPTVHELRTSSPIICYALNPFGSMVAFTSSHDRGPLNMLSTQTLKEQLLLADPGQVTTMAFSADGRHLGIGSVGGIVKVLDMSTRRVAVVLSIPECEPGVVTLLNAGPEGRWVVAYGNRDVVCWSRDGGLLHSTRSTSRVESMATDLDHGRVAIGTETGFVHVLTPDLSEAVFAERVHAAGVVRLAFITNGSAFISASADGSVRRVSI